MSEMVNIPVLLKYSGAFLGAAGAVTSYLADVGADVAALVLNARQKTPVPAATYRNLQVKCPLNPLATALVVTVYKNGVATTITVTITAGSTALFTDSTHAVAFAAGDELDIVLTNTAGLVAVATIVATLQGA